MITFVGNGEVRYEFAAIEKWNKMRICFLVNFCLNFCSKEKFARGLKNILLIGSTEPSHRQQQHQH